MKKKKISKYEEKYPIGHKFGDWVVVNNKTIRIGNAGGYGEAAYEVRCEPCGKTRLVVCGRLVKGESTSCGCWFYGRGSANPNWRGTESIPGRYVSRIEQSAAKREIQYKLTPDIIEGQFTIQNSTCALTGTPLYFGNCSSEVNTNASLDRIDSTIGYVSGNIQWVTKDVNLAKQSMSQNAFVNMCVSVTKTAGYTVNKIGDKE